MLNYDNVKQRRFENVEQQNPRFGTVKFNVNKERSTILDVLKQKRRTHRTQGTGLIGEADALLLLATPSINDIEVLIDCIHLAHDQLNDVDAAIEPLITGQDAEVEFTHGIEYSDKIVTYLTKLKQKMKSAEGSRPARGQSNEDRNGGSSVTSKIKLPKLKLIQFNGHLENWQPFWQQFDTANHHFPELMPSEKFNYLRSALTGDGAAAISGLQPAAECYADAIELLQQRFGKQETLPEPHGRGAALGVRYRASLATNATKPPPGSPLQGVDTFIDRREGLRIRSRLQSIIMTYDERNPIVLPKQHRYSTLLAIDAHRQLLHAGVRDTPVQLRNQYWILRGRELVKKVVRACVTCQRFSATPASVPTGPLPDARTI
ncbi:uncharacterized protein ISCGN_003901 [Ixodes scapularis]